MIKNQKVIEGSFKQSIFSTKIFITISRINNSNKNKTLDAQYKIVHKHKTETNRRTLFILQIQTFKLFITISTCRISFVEKHCICSKNSKIISMKHKATNYFSDKKYNTSNF